MTNETHNNVTSDLFNQVMDDKKMVQYFESSVVKCIKKAMRESAELLQSKKSKDANNIFATKWDIRPGHLVFMAYCPYEIELANVASKLRSFVKGNFGSSVINGTASMVLDYYTTEIKLGNF